MAHSRRFSSLAFDVGGLHPTGNHRFAWAVALRKNKNDSWSVFSDITWHATEQLDLTVGFRYTEDDISARTEGSGLFRKPRIADIPVFTAGDTFDDFTPRFSIGWQATDDMRLYATVSRGYKAGGYTLDYDGNAPNMGIVNERFDEETLWNYEIGLRSEWFDRRLRLNISGFYLEWSDMQLETFFFATPGDATSNIQKTINVEEAEAKGFEIELAAAPAERFLITAGLGYTDSEITVMTLPDQRQSEGISQRPDLAPLPRMDLEYGGAIQLALGR